VATAEAAARAMEEAEMGKGGAVTEAAVARAKAGGEKAEA
jgi:hypothetical protein